ncbi:hypothetical protein N7492_002167 [Penicillium capsulatum]|uniref:Uncharacterized protein n=1 Tax=Penicillium capsulatum TaxID=69766 RepID=A0A9W9LW38_9EURO|nr:hypothetical protein N7492_002167 [Penicillium capsulatum]KAJ6123223.1 hypothetical protein N7512_005688 [Penicillium capsulatum]
MATVTPPGSVFEPLTPRQPQRNPCPKTPSASSNSYDFIVHIINSAIGGRYDLRHIFTNNHDDDIRRHRFIVRMPCPLHDIFAANVADEILQQIRQFQRHNNDIRSFAIGPKHFATSRIFLPEEAVEWEQTFIRRAPDISFWHNQALYPGVIPEGRYSQKRKIISYLADDYILNTDGKFIWSLSSILTIKALKEQVLLSGNRGFHT